MPVMRYGGQEYNLGPDSGVVDAPVTYEKPTSPGASTTTMTRLQELKGQLTPAPVSPLPVYPPGVVFTPGSSSTPPPGSHSVPIYQPPGTPDGSPKETPYSGPKDPPFTGTVPKFPPISRTPIPQKETPMSSCGCGSTSYQSSDGRIDILKLIQATGGRKPTTLSAQVAFPVLVGQSELTTANEGVIDLLAEATWEQDLQLQRIIGNNFANNLWGMYINTLQIELAGIIEDAQAAVPGIESIDLLATFRSSFVLEIKPRMSNEIQYTLSSGVGVPQYGSAGVPATSVASGPQFGAETFSLPSAAAFSAQAVEYARIRYNPSALAATLAELDTAGVYAVVRVGGMAWLENSNILPPPVEACQPLDIVAAQDVRARASWCYQIPR